jgi:hypothetical protein
MRRINLIKRLMASVLIMTLIGSLQFENESAATETFPADKFPYKEMQVQVMPEFHYPEKWPTDKPALLVGYFGTFVNKSGSEYMGEISFPLPVDEPDFEMYLAAEFPEENKPEVQVEYKIDKEIKAIVWKPTKPIEKDATYKYVIEYYANPIIVKDKKSFNYTFTPPTDLEQLDIVFYPPINSKDFTMEPKATNESKSEYGEEIHHFQYTNAKEGTKLSYNASYIKKENTFSMSVMSKQKPPEDENHQGLSGKTATEQVLNGSGGSSKDSNRPLIDTTGAFIIGISMIIMGVFIFFGFKGKGNKQKARIPVSQEAIRASKNTKKIDAKSNEKKELRKLLMAGEIDQQTYDEKIKKLG